jgi:hypothetical protein
MRRQCAKAADQWAQGVADRLNPLAGRPGFISVWPYGFMHTCLHKKGKAKAAEKVSGGRTTWLAGDVARPIDHHLVSYRLNQVGNPSLDPYKYPSTGGNQNTHTHTPHFRDSTYKAPILSVLARLSLVGKVARL